MKNPLLFLAMICVVVVILVLISTLVVAEDCAANEGHLADECAISEAHIASYDNEAMKCCKSLHKANVKDMALYTDKEAFLISDSSWLSVLMFIPVAVWTNADQSVEKYPFLIYHEEESGSNVFFDVDSTIHFLQLYSPSRVTLINTIPQGLQNLLKANNNAGQQAIQQHPNGYTGAGLVDDQLYLVKSTDVFSYWDNYESVMLLSMSGYADGLMASVYASYFNMPILFVDGGLSLDGYKNAIRGKNIFMIGDINQEVINFVHEEAIPRNHFTWEELTRLYIFLTCTDKMILVNSIDRTHFTEGPFITQKSGHTMQRLLGRHSLAAPYLAATKHQAIFDGARKGIEYLTLDLSEPVNTEDPNIAKQVDLINRYVIEIMNGFFDNKANYLTIMASPFALADSIHSYWLGSDPTDGNPQLVRMSFDAIYGRNPDWHASDLKVWEWDVDLDNQGNIYAIWRESFSNTVYHQLVYAQFEQTELKSTLIIGGQHAYYPSIAVDLEGHVNVVFQNRFYENEIYRRDVFYARINPQDTSFITKPMRITQIQANNPSRIMPSIDIGYDGTAHIVWMNELSKDIFYASFDVNNPQMIEEYVTIPSGATGIDRPIAKSDVSGDIHISWEGVYDGKTEIFYTKIDGATNEVEKMEIISRTDWNSNQHSMAVDSFGIAHFTFIEKPNSRFIAYYLKHGTSEYVEVSTANSHAQNPHINIGDDDSVRITWDDDRELWSNQIVSRIIGGDENIIVPITQGAHSLKPTAKSHPNGDVYFLWNHRNQAHNKDKLMHKLGDFSGPLRPEYDDFRMGVGRIYGPSVSDASSYVNRRLFYKGIVDEIYSPGEYTGLAIAHSFTQYVDRAKSILDTTTDQGYDTVCYTHRGYDDQVEHSNYVREGCIYSQGPGVPTGESSDYYKRQFITFSNHGQPYGWGKTLYSNNPDAYNKIPYFDLSFTFGNACSTNAFWRAGAETVGANLLRKGFIAYYGAVGITWVNACEFDALKNLTSGFEITAGDLFNELTSSASYSCKRRTLQYSLLGDPTIIPRFKEVVWE